ncbi:tetratricopeptide repeat protein [Pseudomonas chlororaphis]|uniref:tetratricopeptide repeat protein n=1 Tax=Pseudomonas chlororaphis TaxID=587753 RepID=UPI002D77BD7A|nr:hypothetical protein [Pseudomonas chlororaphis]
MKTPGANRDVVPIWKTAKEASASVEIKPIKQATSQSSTLLTSELLLAEFKRAHNLGVAAELLNIAWLEKNNEALRLSAEFIIDQKTAPPDLLRLSRTILGIGSSEQVNNSENSIAKLRNRLKENTNNPLVWADLARAYAIIHEPEKAEKSMLGALHYANNHRWIFRVASRLYIHFGDPTKALKLLHLNPNLKTDPWLLSTELAVSRLAERPLKNWNQAKKLVESSINPLHLSELASSLGTSEILGGADKKAKAYFKQALISPNSNSLAQVKWADRSFRLGFTKQINSSLEFISSAHEARHWECYEQKDMFKAIEYAKMWWSEEPYSTKPPQAISFIASLTNDLNLIHTTTKTALERNPNDTTLRLNDIYARVCLYDSNPLHDYEITEKDIQYLKSVMNGNDSDYAAHAYANAGLIYYRSGQSDLGRAFYDMAKKQYEKHHTDATLFLLINHYRETLISETVWAKDILEELLVTVRNPKSILSPAADFYLQKINELAVTPNNWRTKFSRPFFIETDTPPASRVEKHERFIDVAQKFWLPDDILNKHQFLLLIKPDTSKSRNKKQ